MAELTTLARPYARAAFEVALADNALDEWSRMLGTSAAVTEHEGARPLLNSPALDAEQLAEAFIEILGEELNEKGRNFVRLLADNKRLPLLPEVAEIFDDLKAQQESSLDVEITTAYEVSSEVTDKLVAALKAKMQRDIRLETSVNPDLIGGAVIRAGDTVIDASVRSKLSKLAESMNS